MTEIIELQNLADDVETETGYNTPVEGKSTASIVC
jgi:hypothetical protein